MLRAATLFASSIALTMGLAAPAAEAGSCDGGEGEVVKSFETFARKGAPEPYVDEICLEELVPGSRLAKRLVAACDTVLRRKPIHAPCLAWSIDLGGRDLGGLDPFVAVGETFPLDPFQYQNPTIRLWAQLGDARALPAVRAMWDRAAADRRAAKKKHQHNWGVWRRSAVELFEALGGATERDFLEAQLAVTTAKGLKKAMRRAIAAIDERAARP